MAKPSKFTPSNLQLPQARILRALEKKPLGRDELAKQIGFSSISGTITRAMNGIQEGSSSGAAQVGLLELGLVEKVRHRTRKRSVVYVITEQGRAAMDGIGPLPSLRDKDACTNWRYVMLPQAKLRALSIRQPFAEQILAGDKTIEYRSKRTHLRECVYIYASKAPADALSYEEAGYTVSDLPRGVVVGTIELVDCTGEEGNFEWHLANPKRLNPPREVEGMPQPGFFWPFGQ